eukprot:363193-Chlamydomonas_euryale.AAC.16
MCGRPAEPATWGVTPPARAQGAAAAMAASSQRPSREERRRCLRASKNLRVCAVYWENLFFYYQKLHHGHNLEDLEDNDRVD